MKDRLGRKRNRVSGKPYTMDGVWTDDIRDYVHSISDA